VKKKLSFFLLFLSLVVFCAAQEEENWDMDSIFDNTEEETGEEDIEDGPDVIDSLRDKVIVEASYSFLGGFAPGWSEAPWYDEDSTYSSELGAKMEALLSLDIKLTDSLRVYNSFYFSVPDSTVFSLKEFYFDYNMQRKFFVLAGLYETAWGISPNYPYTNLPARLPANANTSSDSYLAKVDIPIGIGGLQLLALTRYDYMTNVSSPSLEEFAYGIKYNLAWQKADIDMGAFFYKDMPLRFFVSLKTTLGNTEVYAEALAETPYKTWDEVQVSGSVGFLQDYFRGKFSLNGELFYNGEDNAQWWRTKTNVHDEKVSPFVEGFNTAVNIIFRPGIIGMRLFCQFLYGIEENTAQLVPGISIKPGDLITATLTVPMALGSREGKYYHQNADVADPSRPFSIMFGITFSGSFKYSL
jgi:hypothetical protein